MLILKMRPFLHASPHGADKSWRRVHTNALGRYQLFDLPAGLLQLKVAGQQRSVEVTSEGSAATADVELAPR